MILTGVSTHICAAHRDQEGRLHGHTWKVRAWFPAGEDALVLHDMLSAACDPFDHAELCHEISLGEGLIAALAARLPGATRIELAREPEGIFCEWRAA